MTEIEIRTTERFEMVDITRQVEHALAATADGLCHVHVPHTTAAVVVNENADPDVPRDLLRAYRAMIPDVDFDHAEGNSDSHLLATLLGESVTVPVSSGRLRLGTWQGLFFVELDGPRRRRVWVSTVG